MASSYEMFLRTIRTSSPREQEELWKLFLQRAYPHERTTMLKHVLRFLDREDPAGLRATFREYKEEREARREGYTTPPPHPAGSDVRTSSSTSDTDQPAHRAAAQRQPMRPNGDLQ